MLKALQTSFKSFTTAILCQKSRNRDTISTKMQRRRQSGKYSGEETRCVSADSAQHKTQTKRDKRQNPSHKQQGPGNKPQSSKPPRSVRHSRQRTNTDPQQPASARPNPSQNLNRTCPSRPNRTDYFGRPGLNQSCAPDRIGLHWFAAANNRPRQ